MSRLMATVGGDILPAAVIAQVIDDHIKSWRDVALWHRRSQEIHQARSLL
jgi:hypothetical protein